MEWWIKLETKTCLSEIHEVEIATLSRYTVAATDEDIGLTLAESKAILAALQHAIVTTQIDEYVASRQVCKSCEAILPIRDRRTRKPFFSRKSTASEHRHDMPPLRASPTFARFSVKYE
jgi:ribosomal protein L40E